LLSKSNKDDKITFKNPALVYDENIMQILVNSQNNIELENELISISFIFACKPNQKAKTEIQLSLFFDKYDVIPLEFYKECDTITAISQYFSLLYFIYIVIAIIALLFLLSSLVVCLSSQGYTYKEGMEHILRYFVQKYNNASEYLITKFDSMRYGSWENNISHSNDHIQNQFMDVHDTFGDDSRLNDSKIKNVDNISIKRESYGVI